MRRQCRQGCKGRAVRLELYHRGDYGSQAEAIRRIDGRPDSGRESLGRWVVQTDVDAGTQPRVTMSEQDRIQALEREARELKRRIEFLKSAASFFDQED